MKDYHIKYIKLKLNMLIVNYIKKYLHRNICIFVIRALNSKYMFLIEACIIGIY